MTMKNLFTTSAFVFTAVLISVYSAGYITKSNRVMRESYDASVKKEIEGFTVAMNNADQEIAKLQLENKTLTDELDAAKKSTPVKKEATKATTPATKKTTTTTTTTTSAKAKLTAGVVAKHASAADCWIIVSGKVYSVSPYMAMHPGGKSVIIKVCGQDATTVFTNRGGTGAHSGSAWSMLSTYLVGALGGSI